MATFEDQEYTEASFDGLVLEGAELRGRVFFNCQFSACKFFSADLTGCIFSECVFDHVEWNLVTLIDAGIRSAKFSECKLLGVDFTKCDRQFFQLAFDRCLIDTCNFSGLKLKKTPFERSTVRESRFIESDLAESSFAHSDLAQTLFHQCHMEKADFTGATNYAIDPTANALKGAVFSLPEAISLLGGLGIRLT